MNENEVKLTDLFNIVWKRKWLIIIPTFFFVIVIGAYSFLQPKVWEVDAIISPGKFLIQTEGQFQEVFVSIPKQITEQINNAAYNNIISAELNLNIREFPRLRAENIRDTTLLRIFLIEKDVEKAKSILYALFNHLKEKLDKNIDFEIKNIDTQIAANENLIELSQMDKNKIREEITSAEEKLKIYQARVKSITKEMESVKNRTDELDKQRRKSLSEVKEGIEAIILFLYLNEVQQNLRYYNTLDEKLSNTKIVLENLSLDKKKKFEEIKKIDSQIENVKKQIELLVERKLRIEHIQLIKEPTSSPGPVAPKKKRNVLLAGIFSLIVFTMLAFFIEYIEKQRIKSKGKGT